MYFTIFLTVDISMNIICNTQITVNQIPLKILFQTKRLIWSPSDLKVLLSPKILTRLNLNTLYFII